MLKGGLTGLGTVGSPEWQSFEGHGAKGSKLSIWAEDAALKIFEVRVLYEKVQ